MTMSEIDQPKKVVMYEDNDGYMDGRKIIRIFYGCPHCGETVFMYQDRCHKCEQKLKW